MSPKMQQEPVPEPVAALRRIAFLLERSRAETYRVKAFRSAASTVLTLDPAELVSRGRSGALRDLAGIGSVTATVISESLAGIVPEYLQRLEQEASGPLAEGSERFRGLLRGDLHSHSDWSDGGSPLEEMAFTAQQLGHEYLVLTDHSPRLTIAHGLSAERLAEQIGIVGIVNEHLGGSFRLLKGIEVDILDDGSLDQSDEMLDRLDVVVASVHSKLKMESAAMTRRMVAAVSDPHTNVLGHCTGRSGNRPPSRFDARAVFEACAQHGTAVEINSRPERRDPPDELIDLALGLGCLFSIDSDAHAPGQLDFLDYGCARAAELGVPPERVVNTWGIDRLLQWSTG